MISKKTLLFSKEHSLILDSFFVTHYSTYFLQDGFQMQYYNYTIEQFAWPSKELFALLPSNMRVTRISFGYRSAELTLSNGHLTISKVFGSHFPITVYNKPKTSIETILSRDYIDQRYIINPSDQECQQRYIHMYKVPAGQKLIGIHGAIGDCFGKQYITKLGLITCKE